MRRGERRSRRRLHADGNRKVRRRGEIGFSCGGEVVMRWEEESQLLGEHDHQVVRNRIACLDRP
jgi:hypothetical protein